MTSNTFLSALRKGLSVPNKALLDAIENDPLVQGVIEKAAQNSLIERKARVAELAAVPARHAKSIKAAAAENSAALDAERCAEEALVAARARRSAATGALQGLEMRAWQDGDRIERELRAGAPALLVAASRALWAFSPDRFTPDTSFIAPPRFSRYDEHRVAEFAAASAAADAVNCAMHRRLIRANGQLHTALAQLDALMLVALSDSEIVERVTAILHEVNAALGPLKNSPHFMIDEYLDVLLKFGLDETAYKIKSADVGAEVKS